MSTNNGWNGSTITLGGKGITPLTDLHAPDDPADFDTTGSTDTTHTHGTGLHKSQATGSFLGSQFPVAGTVCSLAFAVGAPSGSGGAPYTQASLPDAPTVCFPTQMSVSGRKDGRIEGSFTVVPADPSLTPVTNTWTVGDLGFNGSTFSFAGTPFTGLVAANYTSSCTPIDTTGAEVGGTSTAGTVYVPGIVEETLTITTLGQPQCAAKSKGATAMSWNDGGSHGTSSGSYTVECVSTHPGGSLDGQETTEHTFKMRRTGTGNS